MTVLFMRPWSFILVPDPLGAPLDERLCRRAFLGGAGTDPRGWIIPPARTYSAGAAAAIPEFPTGPQGQAA